MAKNNKQMVANDKKQSANTEKKKIEFAFGLLNYILMAVGVVVLLIGYVLLAGGGSDDPNVFNEAMFNARRMVAAPIMIVLGIVVEIVAIMINPDLLKKKNREE